MLLGKMKDFTKGKIVNTNEWKRYKPKTDKDKRSVFVEEMQNLEIKD